MFIFLLCFDTTLNFIVFSWVNENERRTLYKETLPHKVLKQVVNLTLGIIQLCVLLIIIGKYVYYSSLYCYLYCIYFRVIKFVFGTVSSRQISILKLIISQFKFSIKMVYPLFYVTILINQHWKYFNKVYILQTLLRHLSISSSNGEL